ncbi:MAG: hypothetical protein GX361_02215 [Bacteroidales bacterium]|nr:hypothetical protein [Bacteroidales bacterium]
MKKFFFLLLGIIPTLFFTSCENEENTIKKDFKVGDTVYKLIYAEVNDIPDKYSNDVKFDADFSRNGKRVIPEEVSLRIVLLNTTIKDLKVGDDLIEASYSLNVCVNLKKYELCDCPGIAVIKSITSSKIVVSFKNLILEREEWFISKVTDNKESISINGDVEFIISGGVFFIPK